MVIEGHDAEEFSERNRKRDRNFPNGFLRNKAIAVMEGV
jgi:hypothetical protein